MYFIYPSNVRLTRDGILLWHILNGEVYLLKLVLKHALAIGKAQMRVTTKRADQNDSLGEGDDCMGCAANQACSADMVAAWLRRLTASNTIRCAFRSLWAGIYIR